MHLTYITELFVQLIDTTFRYFHLSYFLVYFIDFYKLNFHFDFFKLLLTFTFSVMHSLFKDIVHTVLAEFYFYYTVVTEAISNNFFLKFVQQKINSMWLCVYFVLCLFYYMCKPFLFIFLFFSLL